MVSASQEQMVTGINEATTGSVLIITKTLSNATQQLQNVMRLGLCYNTEIVKSFVTSITA